jgi:hypothetical protein
MLTSNATEAAEKMDLSYVAGEYRKCVTTLWIVWPFLKKVNMQLLPDPAGVFSNIFWEYLCSPINTYIWICITSIFKIVKNWKGPWCPVKGEWLNKLWYIVPWDTTQSYELCWVKTPARTVWHYLCNILERSKLYKWEQICDFQELRV